MFLLWVRSFEGVATPQLVYDGDNGRPFLDAAIRSRVVSWVPVPPGEAKLPVDELARRHPPRMGRMLVERAEVPRRRTA